MISKIIIAVCTCLIVSLNAQAALLERLGGLAYYDDEANLTWLADANYAMTSGYDADGLMSWEEASIWVAGLNIAGLGGWRLPETIDVGNDGATYTNFNQGVDYGYNITTHSEMSNMFYNVLGNTAWFDTSGASTGCTAPEWCLTNTGPFSNLQSERYWSATEYVADLNNAWLFHFTNGNQHDFDKSGSIYAWAVQTGDIGAVPIPASVWLFASGLVGLIGMAKRNAQA